MSSCLQTTFLPTEAKVFAHITFDIPSPFNLELLTLENRSRSLRLYFRRSCYGIGFTCAARGRTLNRGRAHRACFFQDYSHSDGRVPCGRVWWRSWVWWQHAPSNERLCCTSLFDTGTPQLIFFLERDATCIKTEVAQYISI